MVNLWKIIIIVQSIKNYNHNGGVQMFLGLSWEPVSFFGNYFPTSSVIKWDNFPPSRSVIMRHNLSPTRNVDIFTTVSVKLWLTIPSFPPHFAMAQVQRGPTNHNSRAPGGPILTGAPKIFDNGFFNNVWKICTVNIKERNRFKWKR